MSQPTFRRALHISSVTKEYTCLPRIVRSGKHGSQTWTIRCQMSRCASNNGHLSTELSAVSSAFIVFSKLSQKVFAATGSSRSGPSSNTTLLLAIDRGTIPHQSHSNYRQIRRSWLRQPCINSENRAYPIHPVTVRPTPFSVRFGSEAGGDVSKVCFDIGLDIFSVKAASPKQSSPVR